VVLMSIINDLAQRGLISPPERLLKAGLYEVLMGSHAFGTASGDSDRDVYGFFIAPLPAAGEDSIDEFRVLNLASDVSVANGRAEHNMEYDVVLYGVEKFFERCIAGKSQSLETLFAPAENILTMCERAQLVRQGRHLFLHQGTAREFQLFAQAQFDSMVHRRLTDGKRKEYIERFGYDVKAAYHSVRLMNEARQLLVEGTLDLRRSREALIAIRQGQWEESKVVDQFRQLDAELNDLYATSVLPEHANREELAKLLARATVV
jgi:predicted nucleotidyltransferase